MLLEVAKSKTLFTKKVQPFSQKKCNEKKRKIFFDYFFVFSSPKSRILRNLPFLLIFSQIDQILALDTKKYEKIFKKFFFLFFRCNFFVKNFSLFTTSRTIRQSLIPVDVPNIIGCLISSP